MPKSIIYEVSDSENETHQVKESNASIDELDPELMSYIDQPSSFKEENKLQSIIYEVSDSEDETHQVKDSNELIDELDPELISHIDHPPSFTDEEHEIQEIVNRYITIECNTPIKSEVENDKSCSDNTKVLNKIYDHPTPGCSHHFVDTQNEGPIIMKTETISPSLWNEGCDEFSTEIEIKVEPDLNFQISPCSSNLCDNVEEPSSSLENVKVPEPVSTENKFEGDKNNLENVAVRGTSESVPEPVSTENKFEGDKNNLENVAVRGTSESILLSNKLSEKSNDIEDNNVSNTVLNEMEPFKYGESLQSLSLLYHQINGLHRTRPDLNQESYFEFCEKIVKLKLNHSSLISEIEKGNLIKFEQLVIWGRNLNRNVEDLIKEAKPQGCILDEAQKFVFKMIRSEIRYRQRLADSKETYIFDDTNHYKFHCMACDRRDDNLTWLVAHLCRDTAEMIYMCCFCGFKFFNNICSLIYHVILDLLEGPKKEFCIECQGFFPSVSDHLVDIEGSWKASCDSCDFISFSRCSLSIHQKYHKMEKHHACPECGAYFVFFELLEDHLRNVCYLNAKKIRHICPICALIFKDKESLCRHLFSIHHQRWIKCIQCHILLISRIQYISHRAQNHPESPCTYQICHTCTLCPGREFKSSAAQLHMKNHAKDVINVIILYVCDCNYYTIHKYNFIEHKTQSCESTPTFGKWDNDHEMKICSSCNDIKFVNLSKPFVCENCEILNSPETGVGSLTKTYECKVCKLFLIYSWEAVIEHFFRFHPNISVHKYPNCVKSTHISGSNNAWISKSSGPTNFPQNINSHKVQPFSLLPENQQIELHGNPQKRFLKMCRINNTSSNVINQNVAKVQPIENKPSTKKKCKVNNVPFYNSLSHFMASNSAVPTNQLKRQAQKKNNLLSINSISSLPLRINDVAINKLEQPVSFVDNNVSGGGYNMLQANNAFTRQDSLSVDMKLLRNNTQQCVSSCESENNGTNSLSGNLMCGKNGIIKSVITPNQSSVKCADNAVYTAIKTPESSYKNNFKSNIIYVKKTMDLNHSEKTDKDSEQNLPITSSEDLIKIDAKEYVPTKKASLECKKCKYKCSEAVELVKHFGDAHHIQNTYQCMECGDCFANLKNKINHLRSAHKIDTKCYLEPDFNRLDTSRLKFRCPVCLRGFLSEQDKNLHMRCHGMAYLQSIRSNLKDM